MNEQQTVTAPDASGAIPDAAPGLAPDAAPANPDDANAPAAVEPDYRALYESVRKENEVLRHNAEIAQSAPVRGVTGGGDPAPADDFLRGFDSDEW